MADALEEGCYAVSADRSRIAWQEGGSRYDSESLSLMDLNTGENGKSEVTTGKYVRVLGFCRKRSCLWDSRQRGCVDGQRTCPGSSDGKYSDY